MDRAEKTLIENYAVVIGDWHFNSLGLIRSLGEEGIPVIYINLSEGGYGESSRYTFKTYHSGEEEQEIVDALMTVIEENKGKPVIFTACDAAAFALDNHYEELKDKCFLPGLKGKASEYMNKENMCKAAKEAGFIVPETDTFFLDDNFKENIKDFGFPCILKPVLSVEGKKSDIQICHDEYDLDRAYDLFCESEENYSRILVQQFIDGQKKQMMEYGGCKVAGKQVQVFGQLEKLREYPTNKGSTSYAVVKKEITHFEKNVLDKMLEVVGYEGLFDLEILLVDGVPYFIEINFRNGAIAYAFTKAGFNIPFVWYNGILGKDVGDCKIKETVLMCERDDLNHVMDKNISIMKWLSDVRKTDVFMIYNKRDSQPFINAYNWIVNRAFSIISKV